MKIINRYFRFAIVLCLLVLPVLAMGQTVVDPWQPTTDTTPEPRPTLLMDPPQSGVVHRLALPPVAREDIEALLQRNERQKRTEVGLGRDVPDQARTVSMGDLYWRETSDGQQVSNVVVESAEARALRVAVDVDSLPPGVVIRFHPEGDASRVFGPYDHSRMAELARFSKEGFYWSPIVEGQSLAMEVSMPAGTDVRGLDLELPRVSHLVTSVRDRFSLKDLGAIGNSGACNVDLHCESDSSWYSTGDSVAKYAFTKNGSTYICTGTLLNDEQQSGTPYFLSANHCVSSSTVAATVNTYWFFERETCGGPDPTSVNQQSGGAQLVDTGSGTDYTLMELNDTPPSGVTYAGWTTSAPGVGSETTAIHHPSGDLKKISFGTVDGYSSYGGSGNNSDAAYIRMLWTISGTTEGGSSGSAIFDPSHHVVGTLTGGSAGCDGSQDNGEPDWYGRFDYTHACISDEIGGTPVASCPDGGGGGGGGGGSVVSLSSGVSESGSVSIGEWGYYSIDVPSGSSRLLVELTGLTADGDLYVRADSQPTESSYDCRPFLAATSDETCDIDGPSSGTWYVAVNGYEATDYTVTATVSGGGGGGGGGGSSSGCTIGGESHDPVLLLLMATAFAGLMASRRRSLKDVRHN